VRRARHIHDVLAKRLFPTIVELPDRLMCYYGREIDTRRIANPKRHRLRYAF